MKHLLLYLLLACTLILPGACTHPTTPPVLLCADSLASANPDSAQALLASLAEGMKQEPQDVQMYYRLLCIKAKDKAYITHTSDSAILPVVEYYEREGDKKHLPEAYYYAGRVYRDLEDAPQALDYFEKALDAMQENENLKVKSKVYAQMGTLFCYQDLYTNAMEAFKQSLQYKLTIKDSIGLIFSYRDIAKTYLNLKQRDSASFYYQKAYHLSTILHQPNLGNGVQALLAHLYILEKDYNKAHFALQHALQNIKESNRSGIYSTAASYYLNVGMKDSAVWYFQQLQDCGTLYAKEAAARGLAEITLAQGKTIAAARHLYQALVLGDSIHKITVTEDIRRSHALYKHQVREKENQHLKLQNLKQRQTGIFLIIAFALLSGSGILYYLRRKKAMQHRLKVAEQLREEAYRRSREYREDTRKRILQLEEQLQEAANQLSNKESHCQHLEDEKEFLTYTLSRLEEEQHYKQLMEKRFSQSDICQIFRQKEAAGNKITEADWQQLEKEADNLLDGFTRKLIGQGKINKQELRVSILIRANFSIKSIAQFIHLSPTAVTSIRRRLCNKFSLPENSPQAWDHFIHSL